MGTKYVNGTAGRVKSVVLTPDLSTSMLDFTGIGSTATNAEITKWTLQLTKEGGQSQVVTFESDSDAQGNLYADLLRGGIVSWSVTLEGFFNLDATSGANSLAKFPLGAALLFDLIKIKTGSLGFIGCKGVVIGFPTGADVRGQANPFSVQIMGHKALPAPTVS